MEHLISGFISVSITAILAAIVLRLINIIVYSNKTYIKLLAASGIFCVFVLLMAALSYSKSVA